MQPSPLSKEIPCPLAVTRLALTTTNLSLFHGFAFSVHFATRTLQSESSGIHSDVCWNSEPQSFLLLTNKNHAAYQWKSRCLPIKYIWCKIETLYYMSHSAIWFGFSPKELNKVKFLTTHTHTQKEMFCWIFSELTPLGSWTLTSKWFSFYM